MLRTDASSKPSGPDLSAIDLEILRQSLIAYADEVAATLANAAPIVEIGQAREFSVAIADAAGGIVAIDNPLHLGTVARTVASIVDYFEFDLKDGDVVLTNDPYRGGTRVQDLTLLAPLFVQSEMVLNVVVRVPIRDMGGQVGGNWYPIARELLAEGVPVTPVKIQRQGRPARDMLGTVLLNGRRADETRRILDAGTAALALAQRRLAELVNARGSEAVRAGLEHAQGYTEQLARAAIAGWRDGTYAGVAVLEDDPSGGGPVHVRVVATVAGDSLTLDFTGSDDQRLSFVNSSSGNTVACAARAVMALLGDAVPPNSGLRRAIEVVTRPGSVTHASPPAPVGWGAAHCGSEITDAVASALRDAVPTPLPALGIVRPLVLCRSPEDRSDQTDLGRWGTGGASAVAGLDGWGLPPMAARTTLPSVEQWEPESGMQVERLEYAPDSGGAGQWTGAPSVEAVIALPADQLYTLWTVPVQSAVESFEGAVSGRPGEVAIHTDEGWQPAPSLAVEQAVAADRLRLRVPGGGGYGPPAARDRAAVMADLEDGLISTATARDVYGLDIGKASDLQEEGGIDHG